MQDKHRTIIWFFIAICVGIILGFVVTKDTITSYTNHVIDAYNDCQEKYNQCKKERHPIVPNLLNETIKEYKRTDYNGIEAK